MATAGVAIAGLLLGACGHQAAQPVGGNGGGRPQRPPATGSAPVTAPSSSPTTTSPLAYSGGGIQSNANQSPTTPSAWVNAPTNSPIGVARDYNAAEYSGDSTDLFAPNGFSASVVALQPYCTPQVYAQLAAQQENAIKLGKNNPQLAAYRQAVANHDVWVDNQISVARIDEAGWTATSEWVNVVFEQVVESSLGTQTLPQTTEHYHVSDINGHWLVDQLPNPSPQAG